MHIILHLSINVIDNSLPISYFMIKEVNYEKKIYNDIYFVSVC